MLPRGAQAAVVRRLGVESVEGVEDKDTHNAPAKSDECHVRAVCKRVTWGSCWLASPLRAATSCACATVRRALAWERAKIWPRLSQLQSLAAAGLKLANMCS